MACDCIWGENQLCVCSKSMLLNDVYVTVNRDKDVNYITTTLVQPDNDSSTSSTDNDEDNRPFHLSSLETQKYLMFYLRSTLIGLKTGLWNNETFITERNGHFLIMDVRFNSQPPLLWFFRFKDSHPNECFIMSRESAIEMYYFLQSVVDFNDEDNHNYTQRKLQMG